MNRSSFFFCLGDIFHWKLFRNFVYGSLESSQDIKPSTQKDRMYKMPKSQNNFHKNPQKTVSRKKVIHIEKSRKSEKMKLYTKLCTLSTILDVEKSVDRSVKTERMFCIVFIKFWSFANRLKKLLTFESSRQQRKTSKSVKIFKQFAGLAKVEKICYTTDLSYRR